MARTRIRARPSMRTARARASASPPRGRCRASSSPTTISTTPMRRYEFVAEFDPARTAAVAIIKHANPCGVAEGGESCRTPTAWRCAAIRSRPSAASSRSTARSMRERRGRSPKIFTEVIIAPDADRGGHRHRRRQENLRLLLTGGLPDPRAPGLTFQARRRRLSGASPRQCRRRRHGSEASSPSARRATAELRDLRFAFRVAKHVKSNAIVYAKDGATVGIGAGQMSRVDSVAHRRAQGRGRRARRPACPRVAGEGLGGRLGCLLPLRRRPARRRRRRAPRR